MKEFTTKASIYSVLAIIGLVFAIYSINVKNHALLVVAILFALVSIDNIFCNLRR